METHLRVAGWLRIVWSAIGVLMALWAMYFFRTQFEPLVGMLLHGGVQGPGPAGALPSGEAQAIEAAFRQAAPVMSILCAVVALFELVGVYAGWALMAYQPWARPFNIVLSIFDLLSIPIGTLIGGYSLWVLFRPETVALFEGGPLERYPTHF